MDEGGGRKNKLKEREINKKRKERKTELNKKENK